METAVSKELEGKTQIYIREVLHRVLCPTHKEIDLKKNSLLSKDVGEVRPGPKPTYIMVLFKHAILFPFRHLTAFTTH